MFTFSNYPPHLPPFHLIHLLYHRNPHPSPIPHCDLVRPPTTSPNLSFVNYTDIPMITLDIHPRSPSQTRDTDLAAISADNPHPHLLYHRKPSPFRRDLARPRATSHDLSFVNYTDIPMITFDIHPRSLSQTRDTDLGAISADNPHPHLLHHDKPSPPISNPLSTSWCRISTSSTPRASLQPLDIMPSARECTL